jgi:CBS domain-containing protein
MLVKHVMTPGAETIGSHETLQEAAHRMRIHDVGSLVVRDAHGRLAGMLTDRDIVTRAAAEGLDLAQTAVALATSGVVITCREDDPLEEAARIMEDHAVRRLVVLGPDDGLAGILSVDDLVLMDRLLAARVIEQVRALDRPSVWDLPATSH